MNRYLRKSLKNIKIFNSRAKSNSEIKTKSLKPSQLKNKMINLKLISLRKTLINYLLLSIIFKGAKIFRIILMLNIIE